MNARVVAVLGAESTGKTQLAQALVRTLGDEGHRVAWVPEVLREFCDQQGRTPTQGEQLGLARAQTERIEAACLHHDIVVADTTAVMTAVYSEFVFSDGSLYRQALHDHGRLVGLTLLTALDLPWQADGLQRDGPQVRGPVDDLIREALRSRCLPFGVVSGLGGDRLDRAMQSVRHWLATRAGKADLAAGAARTRWRWVCESCDDPACEQHWLPGAS